MESQFLTLIGRNNERIEIEITPEGRVKSTVKGITGSACSALSAFLDQLGVVEEDRNTPDYYAQAGAHVQVGK